jgi:hypothetical protein
VKKSFVILCLFAAASITAAPAKAEPAGQRGQAPAKKSDPAPKRDLSGFWLGNAVMKHEPAPAMTPSAQKFFDDAKPLQGPRAVALAKSTDPLVVCDPLGFPRNVVYELRGIAFEHVAKRTLILSQYQRVFREVWTDGRKLPTTVGGSGGDALDPKYYGYSIGSWVDDYTFVVHTTGFNETAWADELGHPRSMTAMVEERYHRIDHDHLEVTVTIDDPKSYTKPYVAMKQAVLQWNPKQEFDEQLCVPSEAAAYLEIVKPAAEEK